MGFTVDNKPGVIIQAEGTRSDQSVARASAGVSAESSSKKGDVGAQDVIVRGSSTSHSKPSGQVGAMPDTPQGGMQVNMRGSASTSAVQPRGEEADGPYLNDGERYALLEAFYGKTDSYMLVDTAYHLDLFPESEVTDFDWQPPADLQKFFAVTDETATGGERFMHERVSALFKLEGRKGYYLRPLTVQGEDGPKNLFVVVRDWGETNLRNNAGDTVDLGGGEVGPYQKFPPMSFQGQMVIPESELREFFADEYGRGARPLNGASLAYQSVYPSETTVLVNAKKYGEAASNYLRDQWTDPFNVLMGAVSFATALSPKLPAAGKMRARPGGAARVSSGNHSSFSFKSKLKKSGTPIIQAFDGDARMFSMEYRITNNELKVGFARTYPNYRGKGVYKQAFRQLVREHNPATIASEHLAASNKDALLRGVIETHAQQTGSQSLMRALLECPDDGLMNLFSRRVQPQMNAMSQAERTALVKSGIRHTPAYRVRADLGYEAISEVNVIDWSSMDFGFVVSR